MILRFSNPWRREPGNPGTRLISGIFRVSWDIPSSVKHIMKHYDLQRRLWNQRFNKGNTGYIWYIWLHCCFQECCSYLVNSVVNCIRSPESQFWGAPLWRSIRTGPAVLSSDMDWVGQRGSGEKSEVEWFILWYFNIFYVLCPVFFFIFFH